MSGSVDTKVAINTSLVCAALQQHRDVRQGVTLQQLFAEDEHRFERLSFDQWGVELGKQLAGQLQNGQEAADVDYDYSTRGLMAFADSKYK